MNEKHTLKEYLETLEKAGTLVSHTLHDELLDHKIECLTYDTRKISSDALFVCKGAHFKPEYLSAALKGGAVAYVCSTDSGFDLPDGIFVNDVRKSLAPLAKLFHNDAQGALCKIGITGTKGKSTTLYYLKSILDLYLESNGKKNCAFISSIDTYDGVKRFESHITTPDVFELWEHFENAVRSGITHLAMEVSSQALKYGRSDLVEFDFAAFTNIGEDHISDVEHKDFEDYFTSKLKIFDSCRTAVINTDSDHADRISAYARGRCNILTYGSSPSDDVSVSNVEKREDGIYFTVKTPEWTKEMLITMPGLFNVSNALCAAALSYSLGIGPEYIAEGLRDARVSGRMQVYNSADGKIVIIVDYAHNKMSFDALYDTVRKEYPGYSVVSVFGCPGKKAFKRRFDLGESANANADFVVLCEEDSGEESFESIASDIKTKITDVPCVLIEDRKKALEYAVRMTEGEKKVILFTGKGEETRLKRGNEYVDAPTDVALSLGELEYYNSLVFN